MRIGDVEHRQKSIAIGKRDAGETKRSPISKHDLPLFLAPVESGCTHHCAQTFDLFGVCEIRTDRFKQPFGAWVGVEKIRTDPPSARKCPVPDLNRAIGRKNRERFEQAVERCRPGAQQSVPCGRQFKLFGAVFGNHHEAAVGQGLGDDAKVGPSRKWPVFLQRLLRIEPRAMLFAPFGKIAHFGGLAALPRIGKQAVESEFSFE